MNAPLSAASAQSGRVKKLHNEMVLMSTTESDGDSASHISDKLGQSFTRGVDLLAPFQVKAIADLDIFESMDDEADANDDLQPIRRPTRATARKQSIIDGRKGVQQETALDDKQKRSNGTNIDIKACLRTLCAGRTQVTYTYTHDSASPDILDDITHMSTITSSKSTIADQRNSAVYLPNSKDRDSFSKLNTVNDYPLPPKPPCPEPGNDFEIKHMEGESVIPTGSKFKSSSEYGDSDLDDNDAAPAGSAIVPAVASASLAGADVGAAARHTQGHVQFDKLASIQNLLVQAQSAQAIDGVELPPALENAWFFRFTSTGELNTPMDYTLDKFTLRTCSYTYSATCGVKSLLFNYYVAGDTSYDPVLIIPDFYQTPFCVAPLINVLVRKKKCAYVLDVSTIIIKLQMHEIIVCYTEFILNVCLHFRTAGRRRSSAVGMGMQETARKISLIGQGSGANIALKLAIAITILSDGLDTLYTYDFARLVTARLMRDGMSNVNLTTMLSVRSVILCNPHLPSFYRILKNKNGALYKLLKKPKSVLNNRAALYNALGYDTGMVADTKLPSEAFPNATRSAAVTPATFKPNYLSFCPQELLNFYKMQISGYTKSTFLAMEVMARVSVPMENMDELTLNVFEMYSGLTSLHRSSFPLNIFLGSDYNLLSGEDVSMLNMLSEENTTVLLRTVPGCGADMLNTCKDILYRML